MKNGHIALFKAPPEDDEDKYVTYLSNLGYTVELVPVIQFDFINLQELRDCLKDSDSYSGIIFTSTRAVEAVVRAIENESVDLNKKIIYVVGEATKNAVKMKLGLDSVGEETGSAENLANFIAENHLHDKRLMFPASKKAKDTLTQKLGPAGFTLTRIDCYDTSENIKLKNAIQNLQRVDVMVFFSPSGVESAFRHLTSQLVSSSRLITIGQTTSQAIQKYHEDVCSAEKPTPESLYLTIKNL